MLDSAEIVEFSTCKVWFVEKKKLQWAKGLDFGLMEIDRINLWLLHEKIVIN